MFPKIVCLCGSTRFMDAFQEANLRETIAGNIVLSIGCNTKSDADLMALGELTEEAKAALDELHLRKIDLADEVLVLNVGGYIGSSTRNEVLYAANAGKIIRWLEPERALDNFALHELALPAIKAGNWGYGVSVIRHPDPLALLPPVEAIEPVHATSCPNCGDPMPDDNAGYCCDNDDHLRTQGVAQ